VDAEPTNEPEPWGDMADRRDTTLAARAVREGWNVPAGLRDRVMKRLAKAVESEDCKLKVAIAVVNAVAKVEKVDQEWAKLDRLTALDAREAATTDQRPIDPAVAAAAIKAGLEAAGKLDPDDASEPY
jgi:hypothetical protein